MLQKLGVYKKQQLNKQQVKELWCSNIIDESILEKFGNSIYFCLFYERVKDTHFYNIFTIKDDYFIYHGMLHASVLKFLTSEELQTKYRDKLGKKYDSEVLLHTINVCFVVTTKNAKEKMTYITNNLIKYIL